MQHPFVLKISREAFAKLVSDTNMCLEDVGLRSMKWVLDQDWTYIVDGYGQEFLRATKRRTFFQKILKQYNYPHAKKKVRGLHEYMYAIYKNKGGVRLCGEEHEILTNFALHNGFVYHEHTALTLGYTFYRNRRIESYIEYGLAFYKHRGHKFYIKERCGNPRRAIYCISGPQINTVGHYSPSLRQPGWETMYWEIIHRIDKAFRY